MSTVQCGESIHIQATEAANLVMQSWHHMASPASDACDAAIALNVLFACTAVVCFREGAVVGRASLMQFGTPDEVVEEEVGEAAECSCSSMLQPTAMSKSMAEDGMMCMGCTASKSLPQNCIACVL